MSVKNQFFKEGFLSKILFRLECFQSLQSKGPIMYMTHKKGTLENIREPFYTISATLSKSSGISQASHAYYRKAIDKTAFLPTTCSFGFKSPTPSRKRLFLFPPCQSSKKL